MTPTTSMHHRLTDILLTTRMRPDDVGGRLLSIHQGLLESSRYVRAANFTSIHPTDLEWLFAAYDERFFGGLIRDALNGSPLHFRLSTRMNKAGGKTIITRTPNGEVRYEIAISCGLLFDAFSEQDPLITVGGVECKSRVEALQRIFEHELVHLLEHVCWRTSNCAAARFQDVAARFFLHQSHRHEMITRVERAGTMGIRLGSTVTFTYEGQYLTGRVTRITKRATILVEDPAGRSFSDGRRYRTYYVPIRSLQPAERDSNN
jgi:hypothetical protein